MGTQRASGAETPKKEETKKKESAKSGKKGPKNAKKPDKKTPRKPSKEPRVVINEILYHPVPDDGAREFIELFNPNSQAVNLSGWSIDGEVTFTFAPGAQIPAGGFVVIGGKADVISAVYGLEGVLGPLKGKLSRKGGEIELVDSRGDLVESVVYDNKPPFPTEAAGSGASIERIHPRFSAPWHWRAGAVRAEWMKVERKGLLSGDRLIFYLTGEGACAIDDVRILREGEPSGAGAVVNSGFESSLEGWEFQGNHSGARIESGGKEGRACLKVVATGPGFGTIHSASVKLDGIPLTSSVVLSFWARIESGSPRLVARISGEGLVTEEELPLAGGSPGAPNRFLASDIEPWIRKFWHEPERPLPGQVITVLARVQDDEAVGSVTLEYTDQEGQGLRKVPMADGGILAGGERAFAAMIPPLADGTVVRYSVGALDAAGRPSPAQAQKAFYVGKPVSKAKAVPSFELLIAPEAAASLERSKTTWVPGMLIFDGRVFDRVRLRHRGHSSLGFPKRHFKLAFDGEKIEDARKINLSASWADKSFLRETLAHTFFAKAGVASCEVKRFARLYINGQYHGLFYQIEQTGRDYLKRNGRDPEGDLFKCYAGGRPSPSGTYSGSDYQNKTSQDPHYDLLHGFLVSMDSLIGAELQAYIKKHVNAEDFAGYLAATAVVMNSDHVGKNYFLYRDPKTDRWSMFPWDLDLTFGRNFECGHPSPLLNDKLRWDNHILFGTQAYPKCDIGGNRLIEKFLSIKENRILLYKKVQQLLKDFTVAGVNRMVKPHYQALRAEVPLDRQRWSAYGPRNTWDFDKQVQEIQSFVEKRSQFLLQGLRAAAASP